MASQNLVDKIVVMFLILVVIFFITNVVLNQKRIVNINEAEIELKEKMKPAELEITKISTSNCEFCTDTTKIIEQLKSMNVNVTKEIVLDASSKEAKELIKKFSIQKLPSFIISGELNKSNQINTFFTDNGEIIDEKFVYRNIRAPYFDTKLNKPVGIVSAFSITDSSCELCVDLSQIMTALNKLKGVYVEQVTKLDVKDSKAIDIIKNNNLKKVPALLISSEIEYYEDLSEEFAKSDIPKKNGYYIVESPVPPYKDLSTNNIVGLVDVIYIKDKTCAECYDVAINEQILQRLGLALDNQKTIDVNSNEGRELIEKYKISKVPIIIISPDAESYPSISLIWKSVGSIESDGWLVMRNAELLGSYKDLETGQTIKAKNGASNG